MAGEGLSGRRKRPEGRIFSGRQVAKASAQNER